MKHLTRIAVVADGQLAREFNWRLAFVNQHGIQLEVDPAKADLVVVTGRSDATAAAVARAVRRRQHVACDQPFSNRDTTIALFTAAERNRTLLAYANPLGRPVAWLRDNRSLAGVHKARVRLTLGAGNRGGVEPAVLAMDALAVALPVVGSGFRPHTIEPAALPGARFAATLGWAGASLTVSVEQGDDDRDDRLDVELVRHDETVRLRWSPATGRPLTCDQEPFAEDFPRRLNDCYAAAAADLLRAVRGGSRTYDVRPATSAAEILHGLRVTATR